MKKLSINEVAKKAGVSISTVSRVINSPKLVKAETRNRVEKIIEEFNYIPLSNARNLSKKVSSIVCIIIPDINNQFCSGIIKGISEIATKNNLTPMIFSSEENFQNEIDALEKVNQILIAGLFLTPCMDYKDDQKGKKVKKLVTMLDAPVVLVDRRADYLQLGGVYYDDATAMYDAVNMLIRKGHNNIALISGNKKVRLTIDREYGFRLALQEAGIKDIDQYIYPADYDLETAYKVAKKLLCRKDFPTAIIGMNNMITMGLIKALGETKLKLGIDIDVVGLDCIDVLRYIGANICFIERDPVALGRSAAALLLSKLDQRTKLAAQIEEQTPIASSELIESYDGACATFKNLPSDSYIFKANLLFPQNKFSKIDNIIFS